MSNGARLAAVLVVVVVAAIGLFFAFVTPSSPPRNPEAPVDALKAPEPLGGLGEVTGDAAKQADAPAVPPPEAFGTPSGIPLAGGQAPSAPSAPPVPAAPAPDQGPRGTAPAATSVPPAAPKEAAPAGIEYVIKSGDTLEGIARAQLGDGQKWRLIEQMNPGINAKLLKPGQKIMLPAGTEIKSADSSSPQGSKVTPAANTYTVQKGDTLVAIARKFYGSDAEWKRILEANGTVLKGDANALKPGMKLNIPPKR